MARHLEVPGRGLAAALAATALGGCGLLRGILPQARPERLVSPFAFTRVAVMPFANLSGETAPECEQMVAKAWTLFYAELARVEGISVVPPGTVTEAMAQGAVRPTSPEEALALARALNVDALVVGAVTSYDPYFKPRVGMAIQVYQRHPAARPAPDILALAERGRPFPVGAPAQAPVAALDRIYDSADADVDRAVRRFARQRDAVTSAFGTERYLRDMEKYVSFVCRQVIVDLIAAERERLKEEAGSR